MADWEDAPGWESAPEQRKPLPLTGRMTRFIAGNLNKGIASVPDALLNTPNRMLNLGKAAFGTAATAAGRPDLAPQITPDPDFVERGLEKVGMITPEATVAETPWQKAAAFGLQLAGGMTVPMGGAPAGPIKPVLAKAEQAATERAAQHAEVDRVFKESRSLGYVTPPSQVSSGVVGNAIEGMVARTTPTERVASVRNAQVTNRIVASDFGITPGKAITDETFGAIRKEAGKAYEAVKNSGVQIKSDKPFEDALQKIRSSDYAKAASEYGEILGNEEVDKLLKGVSKPEVSSGAAVEMTKELRRRATKNIKAWDDLEKQDLGYAQRAASEALEDLIERNLTAAGKKPLVSAWKEGRKTIAKSYDAEAAWDGSNFSAKELAKMMDKGKPLEGGMKQAAEFARHFPKAAQDVTKMAQKSGFSQYDMWGGLAGALATGHPEALAIAGVPWLTQRALLSKSGQAAFARPDYSVGLGLRGLAAAEPQIQRAAVQGAIQEGN